MSFVQQSTIQDIAVSLDVPKLREEAAKALAPDVEFRLREIVQEALKFAKHSKRATLSTEDINNALSLRNVEPMYGFNSKAAATYLRALGHPNVSFRQVQAHPCEQVINAPLPKAPIDVGVVPHWLIINGVQPLTPENAPLEKKRPKRARAEHNTSENGVDVSASAASKRAALEKEPTLASLSAGLFQIEMESGTQLRNPVKHLVAKELQVYFDRVILVIRSSKEKGGQEKEGEVEAKTSSPAENGEKEADKPVESVSRLDSKAERDRLLKGVLSGLAIDPGLHPLTPYFVHFLVGEITSNLSQLSYLHILLRAMSALLVNGAVHLEPYLHKLMPALLTCLLAKTLGQHGSEDHWELRDRSAAILKQMCNKYKESSIESRICRTLLKALLDPAKPLTTCYGVIKGLDALGPRVSQVLLFPQLRGLLTKRIYPSMEQRHNVLLQEQAWRCFDAALKASGRAMRKRILAILEDNLPEHLLRTCGLPSTPKPLVEASPWRTSSASHVLLGPQESLHARTLSTTDAFTSPKDAPAPRIGLQIIVDEHGQGEGNVEPSLRVVIVAYDSNDILVGQSLAHRLSGLDQSHGNGTVTEQQDRLNVLASSSNEGMMQVDEKSAEVTFSPNVALRRETSKKQLGGGLELEPGPSVNHTDKARWGAKFGHHDVLSEAWKEDEDTNALLGELVELFGESFLPLVPNGLLSSFFL